MHAFVLSLTGIMLISCIGLLLLLVRFQSALAYVEARDGAGDIAARLGLDFGAQVSRLNTRAVIVLLAAVVMPVALLVGGKAEGAGFLSGMLGGIGLMLTIDVIWSMRQMHEDFRRSFQVSVDDAAGFVLHGLTGGRS